MTPYAFRPDIPHAFPRYVPEVDADTTPCVIEVAPEHRLARGRWWRPDSAGYTNDVTEAGLYSAYDAVQLCGPHEYPVRARDAYAPHAARLEAWHIALLRLEGNPE